MKPPLTTMKSQTGAKTGVLSWDFFPFGIGVFDEFKIKQTRTTPVTLYPETLTLNPTVYIDRGFMYCRIESFSCEIYCFRTIVCMYTYVRVYLVNCNIPSTYKIIQPWFTPYHYSRNYCSHFQTKRYMSFVNLSTITQQLSSGH